MDEDFPRRLLELETRFSSEEACAGHRGGVARVAQPPEDGECGVTVGSAVPQPSGLSRRRRCLFGRGNSAGCGSFGGWSTLDVGPFRITPFLIDHSAFDSYALEIQSDGKRCFYSGDPRGHGRKAALFERLLVSAKVRNINHVQTRQNIN